MNLEHNDKKKFIKKKTKHFEMNENKTSRYQNLWDATKSVLKGKFIAVNAYNKREEMSQNNTLIFYLNILEIEAQTKPKVSRKKKIKIRVEINAIENRKASEKIN